MRTKKYKKEQEIERKSFIYNLLPIREMLKRGWLPETKTINELESRVCEYLSIPNLQTQPTIAASLRHSISYTPEQGAEIAWARRVEILSQEQTVGEYSKEKLLASLPDLLNCADENLSIARVPAILANAGVHFVIIPHLPKTYLDGAALVLKHPNPIIALTLRHNRVDSFWFTLMHEIAHIVLEHKGIYFDDFEEKEPYSTDHQEIDANLLAKQWLIPYGLDEFIHANKPYFYEEKVIAFSKKIKRHPGIVVGQLHNAKALNFRNLRKYLIHINPYLADFIDVL